LKVTTILNCLLCVLALAAAAAGAADAPSAIALRARLLDTLSRRGPVIDAPWADPLPWIEHKLSASDGIALDFFGETIAIDGTTAFVGAPNHPMTGATGGQGTVYVFTYANGEWTQTQALTADDAAPGDAFGHALALQGSTALISANLVQIGNNPQSGAVYVFHYDGTQWAQVQRLTADIPQLVATFGDSVALDGSNAIIGASGMLGPNGEHAVGAAYVFSETAGSWSQVRKLTASDQHQWALFGIAVGISGDTAIVGASQATWVDAASGPGKGRLYVYVHANDDWSEAGTLSADDGVDGDYFGEVLRFDGTTLLVGAPGVSPDGAAYQGAAYIFNESGGVWSQSQKLLATDGAESAFFGRALALAGTNLAIGAPGVTVGDTQYAGAAYLFSETDRGWTQANEFSASDGTLGDYLGFSVGLLDAGNLLAGAPHELDDGLNMPGAVYAYTTYSDVLFQDGFEGAP
jgi:hypothetical protein